MRNVRSVLLAFSLISCVSSALAHGTLPDDWCVDPNTDPQIVSSFDFSPAELTSYSVQHPADSTGVDCTPTSSTDCYSHGIVDRWHYGYQMSHAYCAAVSDNAMPFVSVPEFNDPANHHSTYDLDKPLKGVCVVCVPRRSLQPPPACPSGVYCLPTDD